MEEWLKWLNENQWMNLIFLLLALLSILTSIYLFLKSKKRKEPVYDKRSINVISDAIKKHDGIEINYKGEKIENLTITKIAFWNDGNDTIDALDQAPTDKLSILIDEGFSILESEVLFQSNQSNNIQIAHTENKIKIIFDYLDAKQGGIIKLIHTGKSSSQINLNGTFKGSRKLRRVYSRTVNLSTIWNFFPPFFRRFFYPTRRKELKLLEVLFPWTTFVMAIMFGIAYFISDHSLGYKLFYILFFIVSILIAFNTIGKKSMPKGFEIFFDDE